MTVATADPVGIELLGPVRAWRADAALDLGPARRRGVFAMLASNANQVVSRAELIDGVWGAAVPTAVDSSLHTYVSALRQCLDPHRAKRAVGEVLVSAGAGYSLRLPHDAVDVDRFDRLRQSARQHWHEHNHTASLAAFDSALSLWKGEPLSGVSGPFADELRARLVESRLVAIEGRAEVQLACGATSEVAAELADLIRRHPLRESMHRLMMLALCHLGERSAALDAYQRARTVLIDKLGIEPGPELRLLHQQVLSGDPVLLSPEHRTSPKPASIRPSATTTDLPRRPRHFVGRRDELARLRDTLRALDRGRGAVVWVEGEPGSGKSALLAHALGRYLPDGRKVLWGNGDQFAQQFPLRLVTRLLAMPQRSIQDVLPAIEQLCAAGPLVLVLDDIQWADDASLYFWQQLCARTEELPLVLIGVNRLVPARPELESLRVVLRRHGGTELTLGPLDGAEVDELVEQKLGSAPEPRLRRMMASAAGNPRYVHDLLDGLVADNSLATGEGTVDVRDCATAGSRSTNAMVISGLDFLPRATAETLRIAASIGTDFDLAVLADLHGRRPSELIDSVGVAVTSRVLAATGDRLAFRHPIVRHALYETLPTALRHALRRKADLATRRCELVHDQPRSWGALAVNGFGPSPTPRQGQRATALRWPR